MKTKILKIVSLLVVIIFVAILWYEIGKKSAGSYNQYSDIKTGLSFTKSNPKPISDAPYGFFIEICRHTRCINGIPIYTIHRGKEDRNIAK
jgi:hypothetical protein